ncbi:MAG: hypothetical protein WD407_12005 [Rhodospirillales bacterium]
MIELIKFKGGTARATVAAACLFAACWPAPAAASDVPAPDTPITQLAQQAPQTPPPGRVRIQGRDQEENATPLPALSPSDPREAMRQFVQSISTYARGRKQNFYIMTEGGLELLIKKNPVDEKIVASARTYMRSIDGILVNGLFYGGEAFGQPTDPKILETRIPLVNQAKTNGLKVLVIDYAKSPREVDESLKLNLARGFVPFAANTPRTILNDIPNYPSRPVRENPKSILSLKDVRNFLYLRETGKFGRQDEFSLHLHESNYDLVIVDVFHNRAPLSKQAVETLKYKKVGARRLVFAHIDIGTAASYRYYWNARWREGSPVWIKAPVPGDPDRYFVEFWQPEWRRLVSGNPKSYIFGIIAQGFDGVILEGVDAYRFFEGSGVEGGAAGGNPF